MSAATFILLGLAVFASSVALDFAAARWARAVSKEQIWLAGQWTFVQWAATLPGFMTAVAVSWWLLPFEGVGLATGSMVAVWWTSRGRGGVTET